jgi:uncharacterized protein (DUF736 family)
MPAVELVQAPAAQAVEVKATKRTFIGSAWKSIVKKEGPNKGKEFINIRLDQTIASVTLKNGMSISMWPNAKRPGKENVDPDFRISIVENV